MNEQIPEITSPNEVQTAFDFLQYIKFANIDDKYAGLINVGIGILLIILFAWLADFITRKVLIRMLSKVVKRTTTTWDDIVMEKKVFNRVAHLIPAIIIYILTPHVLLNYVQFLAFVLAVTKIYMVITVLLAIDSFINSMLVIYNTLKISKDRPIKGYVQVVKILLYFFAIITVISIVLGKDPSKLLASLGALAAVLMFVFKDTILGFVASIQLSANDMVRIGEWISLPSHNADGTVVEITLNTVKIQNWDKTISTIPTYALVSESFANWRGMEESGGRRIKRHINIDMKSVKFLSPELLSKLKKIQVLGDFISKREVELQKYNDNNKIDNSVLVNGRRMTNIGTFRAYLERYLQNHPKIHTEMTFLVRQLQPNEKGIPIEIYVFSNDQAWANFESIQADIFDHILAVLPEFELSVYQSPTGDDFKRLLN